MPLRGSLKLTWQAFLARRLNSPKSTGPRTARGTVWSRLDVLRRRQCSVRGNFLDKIAFASDFQALCPFCFIFNNIPRTTKCPNGFVWRRLSAAPGENNIPCFPSGKVGRKRNTDEAIILLILIWL